VNLKTAIRRVQGRWIWQIRHGWDRENRCALCDYASELAAKDYNHKGGACSYCPVVAHFGFSCDSLDAYSEWSSAHTDSKEENAARLVLADVNAIARAHHLAVVPIPKERK
jgi:hypothetical protein